MEKLSKAPAGFISDVTTAQEGGNLVVSIASSRQLTLSGVQPDQPFPARCGLLRCGKSCSDPELSCLQPRESNGSASASSNTPIRRSPAWCLTWTRTTAIMRSPSATTMCASYSIRRMQPNPTAPCLRHPPCQPQVLKRRRPRSCLRQSPAQASPAHAVAPRPEHGCRDETPSLRSTVKAGPGSRSRRISEDPVTIRPIISDLAVSEIPQSALATAASEPTVRVPPPPAKRTAPPPPTAGVPCRHQPRR